MYRLAFIWFAWSSKLFHLVRADFEFTTSYPRECTTLNVTWKPEMDGFPYSVYVMVLSASVQSWRIDSSYQSNTSEITFQYSIPKISSLFKQFMVAVVDSKGNGNSSQVITPDSLDNHPSGCGDYTENYKWLYASELVSPKGPDAFSTTKLQCSVLNYYTTDTLNATGPFSYSLVPESGLPVTVNIPKSAQTNSSYFYYESTLPFRENTRFYQFMSDSLQSADGGGSPLYTVAWSQNHTCLQESFKLPDLDTSHALPVSSVPATFLNLPGAIPFPSSDNGNGSSTLNHPFSGQGTQGNFGTNSLGKLLGGILGAFFGLLLLAFIIHKWYRKHQKKKQKLDRVESAQFVDLGESILEQGPPSIRQSTLISPFLHATNRVDHHEPLNSNDPNAIGLTAISRNESFPALGTSLGDRSSTGMRGVSRSEIPRSRSDYGLSLANFTSDATEALLDPANDSANQSGLSQHARQHSQGSMDANRSLHQRSDSMYSFISNTVGVLAENELSTAEANLGSMYDYTSMPDNPGQFANMVGHRSREMHLDAGPLIEDSPPPYKFRVNETNSPKP
ncbi:uncharacterized protein FA14DRAFT_38137 [Meira miltonrushii]|uniref:Fibronectin type-III domain-containing protein n=1 Tax=Meira miltonrushii TaxID=1280837 RepID=A0A316VC62_9BASI|nr:uncharacterized protein FA14DRAFT_38137 [Meira miltonrushii]PWN35152.1 hypothetical protein FA14DRAFT_38137 [Meira miltonrushii]